jgi:hypothetical protein
MRRALLLTALIVVAGCGGSGLEGVLQWEGDPNVAARALNGTIRNTTDHAVDLDAGAMRLLDADGRKIKARFRLDREEVPRGGQTRVRVTWKAGKPVRIDYGAGTLALPSE